MNEERTGKCLRQVEHIRGYLWHSYSITVNQVMVATKLALFGVISNLIYCHIIKQLMTFNFGEYKDWSTHGTWYSHQPMMPRWISCSMGWSILVFTSWKVINCILLTSRLYLAKVRICTACGQKWFRFRHLPYIFHMKPLIFITFSWSHSLADFHEIFTFKNRIN